MKYPWIYEPYFTKKEMACRCGCGMLPTYEFMEQLTILRNVFQKSMTVTSAARCQKHNEKVGGSKSSKHLEGIAVDIAVINQEKWDLAYLAMIHGFYGIGVHKSFLHLDARPYEERRIWQYGT